MKQAPSGDNHDREQRAGNRTTGDGNGTRRIEIAPGEDLRPSRPAWEEDRAGHKAREGRITAQGQPRPTAHPGEPQVPCAGYLTARATGAT